MSSHRIFTGILSFYLFFYCGPQTRGFLLQSTRLTEWGDWGEMEKCSPGTFVTGMQLKVESDQGLTKDDTGLNGVKFFCSNLSDTDGHRSMKMANPITSSVGPWGFWRSLLFCSEDFDLEDPLSTELNFKVAVGFRLRSEGIRNRRDDTAANNLILVCANVNPGTGERKTLSRIEGDGTKWGDWTDELICPAKYAICGLATQIEGSKGRNHDDTALNNVDVECCPVPILPNANQEAIVTTTAKSTNDVELEFISTTRKPVSAKTEDGNGISVYEETYDYDNEGRGTGITPEVHPQQSINKTLNREVPELSTERIKIEVSTQSLGLDVNITKHEINNSSEMTAVSSSETKTDIYGILVQSGNDINSGDKYTEESSLKINQEEMSTTLGPLDLETNYEINENESNVNGTYRRILPNTNPALVKNTVGENSELQADRHNKEDYNEYGFSLASLATPSKTKKVELLCICFLVSKFIESFANIYY